VKVKVRNLDTREYVEIFRDEEIRIPAQGYVEMGRSEAIKFLSQATPLNVDGAGRCLRPKKLVMEEDPEAHAAARDQPIKFEAPDGKQFRTQKGFDAYMSNFSLESAKNESKPVRRRRKVNTSSKKQPEGVEPVREVESSPNAS
jgi:hypothetical protein